MKYLKKFKYSEWKKFNKVYSAEPLGNDLQYFNFFTQRYESQKFVTVQEVLLHKYKVIITDHVNRRKVGPLCPVPLKEKLKSGMINLPSKITQKNFDRSMKKFDKGMNQFNKAVQTFSSGLGDGKGNQKRDKKNLEKLIGDLGKSKNTQKIWSDKKSKPNSLKIWSEPEKPKKKKKKTSKPFGDRKSIWFFCLSFSLLLLYNIP